MKVEKERENTLKIVPVTERDRQTDRVYIIKRAVELINKVGSCKILLTADTLEKNNL